MEIDYEKKYEEALAKARAGKTLEEIFPEMNESEDERIREWLVDYFKAVERACIHWDISPERIVAYLEKQKDTSKAIEAIERIDKYIDEHVANAHDMKDSNPDKKYYRGWDDALAKMSGILQDVYSDEKQKEQKLNLTAKGKGVYKICPHCKSRMVRDDSKVYTSLPPQYGYNCPKCGTMEFDTVMYDNPEMEEQIIGSAPLYTIEQVDEKVREAQEWSEEDEKMLNLTKTQLRILQSHLNHTHSENMADTEYSSRLLQIEKCVSWLDIRLKSLRPQPNTVPVEAAIKFGGREYERGVNDGKQSEKNRHWKPSKEQMEALDKALYYVPEEIGVPIAEIYGHFNKMKKKLM